MAKRVGTVRSTTRRKTKVNNICKDIDSPIKEQIESLTNIIIGLQEKLESNLEKYLEEPLYQEIELGTDEEGNIRTKKQANPFVSEYRATLKDFSNNLVILSKLLNVEVQDNQELNELDNIINKIRVVK
jgi:hypothetical protein